MLIITKQNQKINKQSNNIKLTNLPQSIRGAKIKIKVKNDNNIKSGDKNYNKRFKFLKKRPRKINYRPKKRPRFRFRFKPKQFINKVIFLLRNRSFFIKNKAFRNIFRRLFNRRQFRFFVQKRKFKARPKFSFRLPLKIIARKRSIRRSRFRFKNFRKIRKLIKRFRYRYKYQNRYRRKRYFSKSKKKRKFSINFNFNNKRRLSKPHRRFRRFNRRIGTIIRCKFFYHFKKPKFFKRQLHKALTLYSKNKRKKLARLKARNQNRFMRRFLKKIAKRNPKRTKFNKFKKTKSLNNSSKSKLKKLQLKKSKIARLRPKFRKGLKKSAAVVPLTKLQSQKLKYAKMPREKILDTFSVFLRSLSFRGVQSVAEKTMSQVLLQLKKRFSVDPLSVLFIAMDNVRPLIFLKSVKKGGSIQKVPSFLPFSKQRHLGIRWLIMGARNRASRNFLSALVDELSDAYTNRNCFSQRKRQELHKLALLNRSFLRFSR